MSKQPIIVMTPINNLSYGIVGQAVYTALKDAGHPVVLHTHSQTDKSAPWFRDTLDGLDYTKLPAYFFDTATCINVWHQFDLLKRIAAKQHIAYPFFECDSFSDKEKTHIRSVDKVFVASQWAKAIVERETGVSTFIVHPPCNKEVFGIRPEKKDDTYRFFTVGKLEVRKGHDVLAEIFDMAFEPSDNVELHLFVDNPFFSEVETNKFLFRFRLSKMYRKIHMHRREQNQKQLFQLVAQCDCGVFLSRAEGWNLPLVEAMGLNKPVIATNCSAHTEYINGNNCLPVNIDTYTGAYDGKWFFNQCKWAEIGPAQKEQAAEYMRQCYLTRLCGNPYGVETAKTFTMDHMYEQIISGTGS